MSLIEMLVAIAISLIISVALGSLFVTTTKAKQEINRMGEQIENGRIALDTLSQDVRVAGFWDGLEYEGIAVGAVPDICADDTADLKAALPVFVQGIDNAAAAPSCLDDIKPGSDIIAIRRASTCIDGATGCESIPPYFQASKCAPPADKLDGTTGTVALGAELGSADTGDWYAVDTNPASLGLHQRDCGNASLAGTPNLASVRRYIARIYYVANNDIAGDGLPSLKRAELQNGAWVVSTVAAGIQEMHVEYGVAPVGASVVPDSYVTAPATVDEWRRVTAVKIHLLSRNSTASPGHTDSKTYLLGKQSDGTDNSFGPFGDSIRRHVFSGVVRPSNPVGLKGG